MDTPSQAAVSTRRVMIAVPCSRVEGFLKAGVEYDLPEAEAAELIAADMATEAKPASPPRRMTTDSQVAGAKPAGVPAQTPAAPPKQPATPKATPAASKAK